jgi:hypothetical protein
MNVPVFASSNPQPRAYKCDTLEGNWYEDRCISDFDKRKKKNYLLPNPNSWLYDKTYDDIGKNYKNLQKIKERFSEASDNIVNFQEKDYNMYITSTKHALDPKYKETLRPKNKDRNYFKNKEGELDELRNKWTKRNHNFETTYKNDILAKTGSMILPSK